MLQIPQLHRRRGRRRRRREEVDSRKLLFIQAMKFFPIEKKDVSHNSEGSSEDVLNLFAVPSLVSRTPQPYRLSEITLGSSGVSNEFVIREEDSTDYHQWVITNERIQRSSRNGDKPPYRQSSNFMLPGNMVCHMKMLTKFYMDNSFPEYDSVVLKMKTGGEVPRVWWRPMKIKTLTLEFPESCSFVTYELKSFLRQINPMHLEEVHLDCNDRLFYLLARSEQFERAYTRATIPKLDIAELDLLTAKNLCVRSKDQPITLENFEQIVEIYSSFEHFGKLFATELEGDLDFFETLDRFVTKEGWSLRRYNNQLAACKHLSGKDYILVYYCSENMQWVLRSECIMELEKINLTFPLTREVFYISKMRYAQRLQLRQTVFWEPLVHHCYNSITANYDDPRVEIDGYTLPDITYESGVTKAIAKLMENPKSTIEKFKVIGDSVLFSSLPKIQASKLCLQSNEKYHRSFFKPFEGLELKMLAVTTRKNVEEAEDLVKRSKSFVVLGKLDKFENDDEEVPDVIQTAINMLLAKHVKLEEENGVPQDEETKPQPFMEESETEPIRKTKLEVTIEQPLSVHYQSIELNFVHPEFWLDGEKVPDIATPYQIYKKIRRLASVPITIGKLEIIGDYLLFPNVPKLETSELWLRSDTVYNSSFFQPFKGVSLNKLAVSSEMILEEAEDLVIRAKEFVVLEGEAKAKRPRSDKSDDEEPKEKRRKLNCFELKIESIDFHSHSSGLLPAKRARLEEEKNPFTDSAPSRCISPILSPPPSRGPTPEGDYRSYDNAYFDAVYLNVEKCQDYQLARALEESAREHQKSKSAKPKPVHYLSKNFVPQPLFPIPINGYPSTSDSPMVTYEPINHYNLSRYKAADGIGPANPRYPTRSPTPTEPYRPITPFDMKKYEDEFYRLCIDDNESDISGVDQPGTSGF